MAAGETAAVEELSAGERIERDGPARDPYQVGMSFIGAGAGTGVTVAARLGRVMLTEALINGGQEAVLQAASQERKKAAGLEYGLEDALKNVGVATVFGALFGGTLQGGAELARIYNLGKGGAERAARVLDGRPERGDVETLAKEMGVELGPERLDMINRSFEERTLDEAMLRPDASPNEVRVHEAAVRYAEDPDNNPPPELIERMLAEEEAGRLFDDIRPDQADLARRGEPNAVDDIADTFFARDFDEASRRIDAVAAKVDEVAAKVEKQTATTADGRRVEIGGGQLPEKGVVVANIHSDGKLYVGDAGDVHFTLADRYGDPRFGAPEFTGFVNADGRIMDRQEAFRWVSENEKPLRSSENMAQQLDALDYREQVPVSKRRAATKAVSKAPGEVRPDQRAGQNPRVPSDPLENQRIRPERPAEPLDDAAMRAAEEQAGEIREPSIDANGNAKNLFEFLPVEDGNGNVVLMRPADALALADEGRLLAEVMEACKL
ncbi:hypothetical protein [Rhizobium sp. PAMB 3182]